MSKFNSNKVMPRYFAIALVLTLIGFAILGKAMYIMTAKKDYWTRVASQLKHDSIPMKPNRGNILSCDGRNSTASASVCMRSSLRKRPMSSVAIWRRDA